MDRVVAEVLEAIDARDRKRLRANLHPYLHWSTDDGRVLRGRQIVLAELENRGRPAEPTSYELRDGQIYRWVS